MGSALASQRKASATTWGISSAHFTSHNQRLSPGSMYPSSRTEYALLATMREALSNVARHASASRVTVEVEAGYEIVLRISDDGRGLRTEPGHGLGLRNMANRAEALGGRFDARLGDAGGTVVEWAVPPAG